MRLRRAREHGSGGRSKTTRTKTHCNQVTVRLPAVILDLMKSPLCPYGRAFMEPNSEEMEPAMDGCSQFVRRSRQAVRLHRLNVATLLLPPVPMHAGSCSLGCLFPPSVRQELRIDFRNSAVLQRAAQTPSLALQLSYASGLIAQPQSARSVRRQDTLPFDIPHHSSRASRGAQL